MKLTNRENFIITNGNPAAFELLFRHVAAH
jgi:hypothetical protein